MIQNDVVDILVPGEYLRDLPYPALPHLHPEHLVLHLELQFRAEGVRPLHSGESRRDGLLAGEGLVDLRWK